MKLYNQILIAFSLVVISLTTHANPCSDRLAEVSVAEHGSYTPSSWHLIGDEVAVRVVHSLHDYEDENSNSVWTDFEKDPRYHGQLAKPVKALNAAMVALDTDEAKVNRQELIYMKQVLDGAHASWPYFFITWEGLGVRAINRLIANRIYPVGLTDRSMKVDGRTLAPKDFFEHDLGHARGTENIINSSMSTEWGGRDDFSKIFYKQFSYDSIMTKLSDNDKVLFDLGYFLYFHEFIGHPIWGYMFAQVHASGKPTIQALQKVYKEQFYHDFSFDFHADGTVTVSLREEPGYTHNLIKRFLNKGDLWVNLPTEIKNQIKTSPDKGTEILSHFIGNVFTVFFKPHYELARQSLNLQ